MFKAFTLRGKFQEKSVNFINDQSIVFESKFNYVAVISNFILKIFFYLEYINLFTSNSIIRNITVIW